MTFCSSAASPTTHSRARGACVQDLLWSGADVQSQSWLVWKQLCSEKEMGEASSVTYTSAPSIRGSGAASILPVTKLPEFLAVMPCPHCARLALPGWLDLRPAVFLLICLTIPGLCQTCLAFHLQAEWDQTPWWEGLSPQLPAPCPLLCSSALIFLNMKITGCIFSYLDHGKCSCLSDV